MTTPRDDFIEGIYVLTQYRDGYHSRMRNGHDWQTDYFDGFFAAVTHWISGAYDKSYQIPQEGWDETGAFRLVVDAHQNGIGEGRSDEWQRGYEEALQVFQEAKGL